MRIPDMLLRCRYSLTEGSLVVDKQAASGSWTVPSLSEVEG